MYRVEILTYPSIDVTKDIGYNVFNDNLVDIIIKTINSFIDVRVRIPLLDKHFFYLNLIYSTTILTKNVQYKTLGECLHNKECKKYARVVKHRYRNASLKRSFILYGDNYIPILVRRIFGNYYIEPIYEKRIQFIIADVTISRRNSMIPFVPIKQLQNIKVPEEIAIVNKLMYYGKLPNGYIVKVPQKLNEIFKLKNVIYGNEFEIITPDGKTISVNIGSVFNYTKKKFFLLPSYYESLKNE